MKPIFISKKNLEKIGLKQRTQFSSGIKKAPNEGSKSPKMTINEVASRIFSPS
jgi:hypothetical protein